MSRSEDADHPRLVALCALDYVAGHPCLPLFRHAMKSRTYTDDELYEAWYWFSRGWEARELDGQINPQRR